jgi:hypothetical protein
MSVLHRILGLVNSRTTQFEHDRSAYPPITDTRADIADGRKVPTVDIRIATKEGSSFLEPVILAGATAVQLARVRGLTVIGTAGTERGRKLVLSEGVHHVLGHTAPGYLDECVRLSEPRLRTNVEEQVLRHDTEIEP